MTPTAVLPVAPASPYVPIAADGHERYEIVDGQRVEKLPMGIPSTAIASELLSYVRPFVRPRKIGIALTEALFRLRADARLQRRPDFAFVSYDRWTDDVIQEGEAWHVVPNLAAEVVSPTNLARDIQQRIDDYFAAGVQLVWVIFPENRRVYVYASPIDVRVLSEADALDGGAVLPGFSLPLVDLFAVLTKPA